MMRLAGSVAQALLLQASVASACSGDAFGARRAMALHGSLLPMQVAAKMQVAAETETQVAFCTSSLRQMSLSSSTGRPCGLRGVRACL